MSGWPGGRVSGALTAFLLIATALPCAGQDATGPSHEVRVGDTLWDLAQRYLADPFRWPEIFELNPAVVEDPHWIFPGEVLRIPAGGPPRAAPSAEALPPAERRRAARRAPSQAERTGEFPEQSVFRQRKEVPIVGQLSVGEEALRPVVSRSDYYRAAILADRRRALLPGTTARVVEENPLELSLPSAARLNDRVVVGLGGLSVREGDVLRAVRWGRSVRGFGHVLASMALLEVTRVEGDSARATVTDLFADYAVGDPVIIAETYSLDPAARAQPVDGGLVATVIDFAIPHTLVAPGRTVFLDAGADAGVQVGDEFAVFSPDEKDPGTAFLDDRLCTLRVIRVTGETSTAMVLSVQDPGIRPGAPARLVRRLAGAAGG